MSKTLLDDLDAEAEVFAGSLEREHYLNHSGQKDEPELAAIYARHARLFDRRTIDELERGDTTDERYRELHRFAVEGYLENAAKDLTEEIAARETRDIVEWDGGRVAYRSLAPMVRNEPQVARRHALERLQFEATAAQNDLRERRWDMLYEKARELGYGCYRDMVEDVGQLDVRGLAVMMAEFLRRTDKTYRTQLAGYLRGIGINPEYTEKSDLQYVFRQPEYDRYFAAEALVDVYRRTMDQLGLIGEPQQRITLDVENREKKSPRAFCAAPRIPDEVYLVTSPQGGAYDYETMFHEAGHAQHFAHVDRALPFALRGLGDNSVTEGFAFVLEHITREPRWLEYLFFLEPDAYLALGRFNRLYMLRRYAAKLLYEAELHATENVRGMQKRYADILTSATGIRYAPEDYLADVDDGYYAARYLRAWIFDAQLRASFCEQFGDDWYAKPEAGAKLIELWKLGQRYDAPSLLRHEGLGELDIAALTAELIGAA